MQIRKELNLTYNLNRNTALTRTPCLFFGVLFCWLNLITLQNNQTRCSTINLDAFFRSWACGRSRFEMIGGTQKNNQNVRLQTIILKTERVKQAGDQEAAGAIAIATPLLRKHRT